jgi:hypothetical protein
MGEDDHLHNKERILEQTSFLWPPEELKLADTLISEFQHPELQEN